VEDGIYPSATGQALIANAVLEFISDKYGTNFTGGSMKRVRAILVASLLAGAAVESPAAITLPASGVLAGPLDESRSLMADAFANYPFGSGGGAVNVHGWVSLEFSSPVGRTAKFRIRWHALGDTPLVSFADGHYVHVTGEQNLDSGVQVSQGELNLDTGEVANLDVHGIFQNVLVQKASRYNRLPLISDASAFTALFVDFPPLDLPFDLPYEERPATSLTMRFVVDAGQRITGFELHGLTFVPITVFPALGLMPPFTFAREGATIIPGMEGCFPGTPSASNCLSEDRIPDGLIAAVNAYLNPQLRLVTSELREIGGPPVIPPARPGGGVMGAGAAVLDGKLYVTGGSDGERANNHASTYDPARNEWTTLADMPRGVWQHCAATGGGKVYVAGGREGNDTAPVTSVVMYDPSTDAWTAATPLPVGLADAACASLDSRIYLFGGATATAAASDGTWVFDTGTGQWSALPRMPIPLAGSAVAVAGRDIWVINGTSDGSTATNRVLVFSPDSGTWREGPVSNRALYGASAAWLDGRIFLAGGRTAPGGALDVGNVLYFSQTMQVLVDDAWHVGLYPPLPASRMAGGVSADTWYLVGGDTASTSPAAPTGIVQAFATVRDWVVSDSFPVFTAQTVRNAAGLGTGPAELAPGTMASIIGTHLAERELTAPGVRAEGSYLTTDLPEELGGIRVTVDGKTAGIIAVSPKRIDFQVPFALSTGRTATVRVSRNGIAAPAVQVRLEPAAPGIFTYTYGETRSIDFLNEGAAIATNADGTLNYPSQPAHPGDTITLRVTGLGAVEQLPEPLQRGPREEVAAEQIPEVLIDGRSAVVQSAVLAAGEAGLYDVQVTIPRETRTGIRVLVQLRSGGILSNPAVLSVE
jgi:uncharacterized protein (TIGR03437 family)